MIWTYRCPEKVILHNAVTCKSIGADTQRMLTPEFGGISEPALSPQFVHACIDRDASVAEGVLQSSPAAERRPRPSAASRDHGAREWRDQT